MDYKNILNSAKLASIVCFCWFLSGCASIPETIAKSRWEGHPVREALVKWGRPNLRIAPAGDGATLYEWAFDKDYAYTAYVGSDTRNDVTTNFYERRLATAACRLSITANASGIITNFVTTQSNGGCADFYWGAKFPSPDEETSANGKILDENLRKIKRINERYKMVCAKPEYAVIFKQPPCDTVWITTAISKSINILNPTREQRAKLLKWGDEMYVIVNEYREFFSSTGSKEDKQMIDLIARTNPSKEKPNSQAQWAYIGNWAAFAKSEAEMLASYGGRTYGEYKK